MLNFLFGTARKGNALEVVASGVLLHKYKKITY